MLPAQVRDWFAQNSYGDIVEIVPVAGGCINNGIRIATSSGIYFFLKVNEHAPVDMFDREAEGLAALNVLDGPRVPRPYLNEGGFLLMEDLAPGKKSSSYWADFGRQLAALHLHTHNRFGFEHDNYIGSTPQPNPWLEDGYEFFAEQRLIYQALLASRRGLFNRDELRKVERLAARLRELIPLQPASLIHGDLWSGNAISDQHGDPAIIDPAAHYGWREAELAMTTLFGSFPNEIYRAYQEIYPLEAGFEGRYPIYNLYHLINHLNLFGGMYHHQVISIIDRYV
jgi:protein-ribulosamine 3-kinase